MQNANLKMQNGSVNPFVDSYLIRPPRVDE